jgi:RNA polymerase sigma factor (sigma-70 family)
VTALRRALARADPLADPEPLIARVYGYVAYRIGHGADAEDATSETFARALRYRDSYDPAKGAPIGWLIAIVRRCVDESFGRPPAAAAGAPPPPQPIPDLAGEVVERLVVRAAVARLGARDRELIALRYGADLSAREIAQRLELSVSAVDVALHRARAQLRTMLSGEDPVHARKEVARRAGSPRTTTRTKELR